MVLAAVHVDVRAVDAAGAVGQQEAGDVHHLRQADEPAGGKVLAGERGKPVGVALAELVPAAALEQHGPRAERVHPDAARPQLGAERGGQVNLGGLRRPVRGLGPGLPSGDRRDDQCGAATVGQVRHGGADQVGRVQHVQRERLRPVLRRRVGQVAADRPARVGDDQVETAERGRDLLDGAAQRGGVGDIGGHTVRPGAAGVTQLTDRRRQPVRVAAADADRRPLAGQPTGDAEADARRTSADERALTAQSEIHARDHRTGPRHD